MAQHRQLEIEISISISFRFVSQKAVKNFFNI